MLEEALYYSKTISYVNSACYLYWDNGVTTLAWGGGFDYNKHINRAHANIYSHIVYYDLLKKRDINGYNILLIAFNTLAIYYYSLYKNNIKYKKEDINKEIRSLKPYLNKLHFKDRFKFTCLLLFPRFVFFVMKLLKK